MNSLKTTAVSIARLAEVTALCSASISETAFLRHNREKAARRPEPLLPNGLPCHPPLSPRCSSPESVSPSCSPAASPARHRSHALCSHLHPHFATSATAPPAATLLPAFPGQLHRSQQGSPRAGPPPPPRSPPPALGPLPAAPPALPTALPPRSTLQLSGARGQRSGPAASRSPALLLPPPQPPAARPGAAPSGLSSGTIRAPFCLGLGSDVGGRPAGRSPCGGTPPRGRPPPTLSPQQRPGPAAAPRTRRSRPPPRGLPPPPLSPDNELCRRARFSFLVSSCRSVRRGFVAAQLRREAVFSPLAENETRQWLWGNAVSVRRGCISDPQRRGGAGSVSGRAARRAQARVCCT